MFDSIEVIDQRSSFYKANFRRLLNFCYFLSVMVLAIIGLVMYQHFTRPDPHYFVTTSEGMLFEILPQ
jgi:hypothetical protein